MRLLGRGSPRITFVVGLLLSFPGVSYLAALTRIDGLDAAAAPTALLVIGFCLMQQTLLELPLIGYALAPERTQLAVDGFRDWLARNGRRAGIIGAAVIGALVIHPWNRRAGELTMAKWGVLVVLGAAQFLMVLDQAVMNVAISQLVEDFDTTVTTIQAVIALYALVMAGLMLTGGKLGDIIGRRRAFAIGLVIYGAGSALTAASWSVPSLMLGWSILEGIGAALVHPGPDRPRRRQLQGQRAGDRLRRARRRRRRRHRGRADPRRLGDDRAELAGRLRRRGRRRDRDPDRHPADPRAARARGEPQPRLGRRRCSPPRAWR